MTGRNIKLDNANHLSFLISNYPLKNIDSPTNNDVLCGRGGLTNNHMGNCNWRKLVSVNKRVYISLPKQQKMTVAKSIVQAIRDQSPPGRFLQKDTKTNLWFEIGDPKAIFKTSQALREGAPYLRKEILKENEAKKKLINKIAPTGNPIIIPSFVPSETHTNYPRPERQIPPVANLVQVATSFKPFGVPSQMMNNISIAPLNVSSLASICHDGKSFQQYNKLFTPSCVTFDKMPKQELHSDNCLSLAQSHSIYGDYDTWNNNTSCSRHTLHPSTMTRKQYKNIGVVKTDDVISMPVCDEKIKTQDCGISIVSGSSHTNIPNNKAQHSDSSSSIWEDKLEQNKTSLIDDDEGGDDDEYIRCSKEELTCNYTKTTCSKNDIKFIDFEENVFNFTSLDRNHSLALSEVSIDDFSASLTETMTDTINVTNVF